MKNESCDCILKAVNFKFLADFIWVIDISKNKLKILS